MSVNEIWSPEKDKRERAARKARVKARQAAEEKTPQELFSEMARKFIKDNNIGPLGPNLQIVGGTMNVKD